MSTEATGPTFPQEPFMPLYDRELNAALSKELRPTGIAQERKNCIVGTIAFSILAVIAVAGAAYVMATTGGPTANPVFFYTAVGVGGSGILIAVIGVGMMASKHRKAKVESKKAVQRFTNNTIDLPTALEKLACANRQQFNAVMSRLSDEQVGVLVKHLDQHETPQVIDALALDLETVKRIPADAFSQELALELLPRFNPEQMRQEENLEFLSRLLCMVPIERESSPIFATYPEQMAQLTAANPRDYAGIHEAMEPATLAKYIAVLVPLAAESAEKQAIENKIIRHVAVQQLQKAHTLGKDDIQEQLAVLSVLEGLGVYAEFVIGKLDVEGGASVGYPHFVMLMHRLREEAESPDVENTLVSNSRARLMARFYYYPNHQNGETRRRNAARGLRRLPELRDADAWGQMRAIVEPFQSEVWTNARR